MNFYSICTKWVCHSYYQLLVINSFNIILKVNIQLDKHFIERIFYCQRDYYTMFTYIMALGHIYTNNSSIHPSHEYPHVYSDISYQVAWDSLPPTIDITYRSRKIDRGDSLWINITHILILWLWTFIVHVLNKFVTHITNSW